MLEYAVAPGSGTIPRAWDAPAATKSASDVRGTVPVKLAAPKVGRCRLGSGYLRAHERHARLDRGCRSAKEANQRRRAGSLAPQDLPLPRIEDVQCKPPL